ncbi:MAG: phosphoribosyl-AMP cyclohydrolase [Pseudomonadota bacterium]
MTLPAELEAARAGTRVPLAEMLDAARFNEAGLLPAIAQDHDTGQVLMLAWADREAIERTLRDGCAWYYSRSRKSYWRKGDTSGHVQELVSVRFDCDADTLLYRVRQTGGACHTNRQHCFYLEVQGDEVVVTDSPPEQPG